MNDLVFEMGIRSSQPPGVITRGKPGARGIAEDTGRSLLQSGTTTRTPAAKAEMHTTTALVDRAAPTKGTAAMTRPSCQAVMTRLL